MKNRNKILTMIGFAYKSGKVISGQDPIKLALRKRKIKLLIIAEDASNNTKDKFTNSARYYNVPYFVCLTKEELSMSLGRKIRSVIGIIDENFAKVLISLLENNQ
ncbi:MAG TPA: 50S ribosomal protein L7ae [Clostridiales bacterium]|nr:50S ribosomal protein L7ae [Clostridiales bacterium]